MSGDEQKNEKNNIGRLSAEDIRRRISAIQNDPYSEIVTHSEILVAMAQLRSQRSLDRLDYIRTQSRGNTLLENIKAVEDSLNAICSLYEMALEYVADS